MPACHAQCGPSMAWHTGEALAAWEAEDCHLVKAHIALHTCEPRSPQDGPNWWCWGKETKLTSRRVDQRSLYFRQSSFVRKGLSRSQHPSLDHSNRDAVK